MPKEEMCICALDLILDTLELAKYVILLDISIASHFIAFDRPFVDN